MLRKFMEAYDKYTRQYRFFGISFQMMLSVSFTVMALVLAICFPSLPYKWFCLAGMAMSLLGDILLTPDFFLTKFYHGDLFLFGGAAFLVAHLLYAQGFLQKASMFGQTSAWKWIMLGLFFGIGMAFLLPSAGYYYANR